MTWLYMALGIDSLGIQSLKALATQLGVATGKRPLNREKPSALAEGVFTGVSRMKSRDINKKLEKKEQ